MGLLLPGPEEAARRQRLALLLRELCAWNSAWEEHQDPAPASGDREELQSLERGELSGHLDLLARAYLGVGLPVGGFFTHGVRTEQVPGAWNALERERGQRPELPHPPVPGEAAVSVAQRILVALEQQDPSAFPRHTWELRGVLARGGPDALAQALEGLERQAELARWPSMDRRGVLALAFESWLERGQLLKIERFSERFPLELALDERLLAAAGWARLALERGSSARSLLAALRPPAGGWPRALVEWADQVPSIARDLGLTAEDRRASERQDQALGTPEPLWPLATQGLDRARFGAACLLLVALVPGADPRVVAADLAPALEPRLARFESGLAGALRDPRRPEARLLAESRDLRRHATASTGLDGTLGNGRAQWLYPILDGDGEVQGWIHGEWEHHLLPRVRELERLAAAVKRGGWLHPERSGSRAGGLAGPGSPQAVSPAGSAGRRLDHAGRGSQGLSQRFGEVAEMPGSQPGARSAPWSIAESGDPRAEIAHRLAGRLGLKWGRRRWWCVEFEGESPRLIASDGPALGAWAARPGAARALRRARLTGLAVEFDGVRVAAEGLGLSSASASGLVLPLAGRGSRAFFLVESERRADFASVDLVRLQGRVESLHEDYERARFRAWARAHWEGDLCTHLLWPGCLEQLTAAVRGHRPPAISGPPGVGRTSLLAWIAFLRREDGSLPAPQRRYLPNFEDLDWQRIDEPGEPWAIAALGAADWGIQERLAKHLALRTGPSSAGTRELLLEFAPEEVLFGPLDCEVRPGALPLSALRDNRAAFPELFRILIERSATREGRIAPELEDCAAGQLWRQEWPLGLRQIAEVLQRCVLQADGLTIGLPLVQGVLRSLGLRPVAKLPSRHPPSALLEQALRATALGNGRSNKTRAAAYLGWDTDTLEVRLEERGLAGLPPPIEASEELESGPPSPGG